MLFLSLTHAIFTCKSLIPVFRFEKDLNRNACCIENGFINIGPQSDRRYYALIDLDIKFCGKMKCIGVYLNANKRTNI
jgi:hypothetical protein